MDDIFLIFLRKKDLKLHWETFCMKRQYLFCGKIRNFLFKMSCAEIFTQSADQ